MNEWNIELKDICQSLINEHKILGFRDMVITAPSPINGSIRSSIAFCNKRETEEARKIINDSVATVIICPNSCDFSESDFPEKVIILVENPRMSYIKILKGFFEEKIKYGISSEATVDKEAIIDPEVSIGPNTNIGKVIIGKGTIIHGNVTINDNTRIGENVIIHSGVVIGSTGFGYERSDTGELLGFPHVGGIVIDDDVEIGANTCIDRGTLGDTIIGKGTKIDNLCHIAHNVIIGRHCVIIALTLVGGSTHIDDYTWVAPCVCIRDGLNIGKNSTLGMGTVVTKNIANHSVVMGIPGKKIRDNPIPNYLDDESEA